jgi:hypothetical protein
MSRRRRSGFGKAETAWWDPEAEQARTVEYRKEHRSATCRKRFYFHKDEDIETPYPLKRVDYDDPCFAVLVRERQPLAPPKYRPGQYVYSSFRGANVPVVDVRWDPGVASLSIWRVLTPGFGSSEDEFSPANAHAPTHQFEVDARGSWAHVGTLPPSMKWRKR